MRYSLYIPPKDTRDQISTLIFPGGLCPDYKVCATGFLVSGVPNVNNPLVPTWGLAGKTLPRSQHRSKRHLRLVVYQDEAPSRCRIGSGGNDAA